MKPQKESLASIFASKLLNGEDGSESSSDEDFVCGEDVSIESDEWESDNSESDESDNEESESDSNQIQQEKSSKEHFKPEADSIPKQSVVEKPKLPKIKNFNICCICLNEENDTSDEIVSCDSCGFNTHEGCYGVCDTESYQSSGSTASTEPWFCNSCLVIDRFEPNTVDQDGLKCFKRNCELCPNTECGLLKETENGKFVHIVCALYISGVAYQWPDRLWPVVLNEIPSTNWGDHVCSLCDDVRYSRTGVCIKCDAGMCKNYFHVTCAQKHGLLVDPFHPQNSSDPFIGYCKLHNDPNLIKSRKNNYFAMMSSYRSKNLGDRRMFEIEGDENKKRLIRKLNKTIEKYELDKEKMFSKPTEQKKSRLLTTCPQVLKNLLAKNKSAEVNNLSLEKKAHFTSSVTFTSDFIKYYIDRETKIPQYVAELEFLKHSQIELTEEEANLRIKYESGLSERQNLLEINRTMIDKLKIYSNLLKLVLPDEKYPRDFFQKIFKTVEIAEKGEKNDKEIDIKISSITPAKRKWSKQSKNVDIVNNLNIDSSCIVCNQKTNSHLMIDCDTCRNIYHIVCLDPPLGSVPKKTKLYGWECVSCVQKKQNSDEELVKNEPEVETENKRARRERKKSVLNKKSESFESPKKKMRKRSVKPKKNDAKKDLNNETESQNSSLIIMSDNDISVSAKKLIDSDSEAIYILDDESESPKRKFKSNSVLNKNIRAFKALPVDSGNEAESDAPKRSRQMFKNSLNQKEEIENSVGDKIDSTNVKKESTVKSPNIKSSAKIK